MIIKCDGLVYNPLGGASYIFEKEIIPYLLSNLTKEKIKISVGAQPNSSPHMGTIETIILSFVLAQKICLYEPKKKVSILYEVIETAPGELYTINNIRYQKNLVATGTLKKFWEEYVDILEYMKKKTLIDYEIRYQYQFNGEKETKNAIKKILINRKTVAERLDQKYKKLRMRMPCPVCGLTDKNSINTRFFDNIIEFYCPYHGYYRINVSKDISKLEYNSPLRNLIRAMVYTQINNSEEYDYQIFRVTGSDYAGFYQEELRYKLASYLGMEAHKMSMIFYAPLIVDWSGAKLSKSLYVEKNAYEDIPKEFINYKFFKEKLGHL